MSREREYRALLAHATATVSALRHALEEVCFGEGSEATEAAIAMYTERAERAASRLLAALPKPAVPSHPEAPTP